VCVWRSVSGVISVLVNTMSGRDAQVIFELVRADAAKNAIVDVYQLTREIQQLFPELSEQEVVSLVDIAIVKTWAAGAPGLSRLCRVRASREQFEN
jgi:hypothetical protein